MFRSLCIRMLSAFMSLFSSLKPCEVSIVATDYKEFALVKPSDAANLKKENNLEFTYTAIFNTDVFLRFKCEVTKFEK